MSCCYNNTPNTISNCINIGINPKMLKNYSCIRVNIPLNLCNKLRICGKVINNCNGSPIPYAKIKLLKQDLCTGCYKCIVSTTANSCGIYQFNLILSKFSNSCSNYKIVASLPCNYNHVMPISHNSGVTVSRPHEGSIYNNSQSCNYNKCYSNDFNINYCEQNSCSYDNIGYHDQGTYNNFHATHHEYKYPVESCYGNCFNNSYCDCYHTPGSIFDKVQESQDICTKQKNECSESCDLSNLWND